MGAPSAAAPTTRKSVDGPVDLARQGVAEDPGERDRDDRGERRAVGEPLAHAEHEDERRHHQHAAAHAEQPGQEPGADADERDPQHQAGAYPTSPATTLTPAATMTTPNM